MKAAAFALALIATPALAAPSADELRFIACPIYRDADAGKKSGCWLVDDRENGLRYDVSLAPAKPDWNYAALVEGKPAKDQTDACGGVVLDPVRVSIIDSQACTRHMLPAEGYPGRKFVLPQRTLRPLYLPRPPFAQPYAERAYVIPFDFGRSFIDYQLSDYLIDEAVAYALASHAAKVEITGYAATQPAEVSGTLLTEPTSLAEDRAKIAAQWMTLLGVPADRLSVSWKGAAEPVDAPGTDGLSEPSRRRVDIRITPGAEAKSP